MTPGEAAARLRDIADKIDASSNPSLTLVAADIRKVLHLVVDAGSPARQATGPAGRRMSPARSGAVDVTNDREFHAAKGRVASTKR